MSELRPESPVRRPDTARPRAEPVPEIDPPDAAELDAIARHLVTLPGQEGAAVLVDEELGVTFVRGPGSGPDLSYATMPHWDVDTWPAQLSAVREHMRGEGIWPSLLTCDRLDRPPGLDLELELEGWTKVTTETVMWVGHASVVPHLDPLMRIEAVRPGSMERHEALEREIFGIGADQAERRRSVIQTALEAGVLRAWVVWLADEPVAVSRLSQGESVAGLQGLGVVAGRRGQGFGRLITTVATRAGMAVGNRIVWLSVSEDNEPAVRTYTRLGFVPAFTWTRWLATEDPRRR